MSFDAWKLKTGSASGAFEVLSRITYRFVAMRSPC